MNIDGLRNTIRLIETEVEGNVAGTRRYGIYMPQWIEQCHAHTVAREGMPRKIIHAHII